MKTFKKIVCIFLTMMISILSCVNVSAYSKDESINITRKEKELLSLKENTKLLNYFYEQKPDDEYDGKYFPDYYGGSYIENDGSLVIMIKDNQGKDIISNIIDSASFVSCNYSYSEIVKTLNFINKKIKELKNDPYSKYFSGLVLNDKENTLTVYIKELSFEKERWFKEKVSNKAFLRFASIQIEPQDHINYSGQGIETDTGILLSGAFRVKRSTVTGMKYGFITCGHGNSLFQNIKGADGITIGSVQLRQYSGSIDASYVQMSNSTYFSNNIHGSPYTLNNENDDLYYPTVGQGVWIHARMHLNDAGLIQSTNVSYSINGSTFSGLYGANYPCTNGDSGGLICSSAVNQSCNPTGVHKGIYNGMSIFTSAVKIVNNWYFMRY